MPPVIAIAAVPFPMLGSLILLEAITYIIPMLVKPYACGEGRRFAASGSGGLSERYVCVGFPVPWEQLGEAVLRDVGDAGEDIG